MARPSALTEHLFRRAGFGLSAAERQNVGVAMASLRTGRRSPNSSTNAELPYHDMVEALLNYDAAASDVDGYIGQPGYVGITAATGLKPNTTIAHARQRWLFRMVHSPAPLQEKMALFWHHHFATAYSKISGTYGSIDGTRLMAAKPSEDPFGQRGQIELFRQYALGRFEDLLVQVAKDPAMVVWLDGRTNVKAQPQENFGRELMELFTFGVEHYVEADVYAAARVFTGWNLTAPSVRDGGGAYSFNYRGTQHETAAKDFSFPIYATGSSPNRIPSRSGDAGLQDGLDLIHALAFHPETAKRLARRLWTWFVSETENAPDEFVSRIASVYLENNTSMREVMRAVLLSPEFQDPSRFYTRYAWPPEFVARALKEVGYVGFSVNDALTPLLDMGLVLYEPPDVNGWELGHGWFSSGAMLARMNFASRLATNQRVALRDLARPYKATPESLVAFVFDTVSVPQWPAAEADVLTAYVRTGGTWTGSDSQLLTKAAGVFHLAVGSAEYQFV